MILSLFGYPKTGKTLLFNLLTNQHEQVSKFSLPSVECHKAVVDVPDPRLTQLAEISGTPPVHAKIEYLDTGFIAKDEVKDSTFIDLLRRADGLVHLVRGFVDPEIPHPQGTVDPQRDIRSMEDELVTVDFVTIGKRLEKLAADLKKIKNHELEEEAAVLGKIKGLLEAGQPLRAVPLNEKERTLLRGFKPLSAKPLLHVINADENSLERYTPLVSPPPPHQQLTTVIFAGKIEQELLELNPDERPVFQREYGLQEYHYLRDGFINTSFTLMNLISFFTIGKEETKSWTVEKETTAFQAAGKIHSDIQRGFIRAEVINWQDFLSCGGFAHGREKGLLRLEGKDYSVRDGDVIHFRFNA